MSASQLSQLSPTGSSTSSPSSALQAKLAQLGPQGEALLHQLEHAVKVSLADSITEVFLLGAGLMVVCFIVTLFLKEIPLRKSHEPGEGSPTLAAEAQVEEAAATFGM